MTTTTKIASLEEYATLPNGSYGVKLTTSDGVEIGLDYRVCRAERDTNSPARAEIVAAFDLASGARFNGTGWLDVDEDEADQALNEFLADRGSL